MDLVIYDVPDVKEVKEEIINNAMTTIANYLNRQRVKSQEEKDTEEAIEAIKAKNII